MRKLLLFITACLSAMMPVTLPAQLSLDDIERQKWSGEMCSANHAAIVMQPGSIDSDTSVTFRRLLLSAGKWQLTLPACFSAEHGEVIPYDVPGSVHSALAAAGVIADPVVGLNDSVAERCSYMTWHATTYFDYDGTMTDPLLSFKGVANKCRVYINGKLVTEHEGMFGGPDIAAEKYLKTGRNTLSVELLPIPEIYDGGWPATANEAWKHTVTANCVYGWHYSKIPSTGIWNDVELVERNRLRIENPFFITRDTDGHMCMRLTFPNNVDGEIHLTVSPLNFNGKNQNFTARVDGIQGDTEFNFTLKDPQLWWPNDAGEQNLYKAHVRLVKDGHTVSVADATFGIRTIEMKPFHEGPRKDLYNWTFCINGRDMFVKGTGWCMQDVLLDFTTERYDRFLSAAADQHIQLLRAWGGGIPETDDFYHLCDRKGIMVIQEWPTAWNSHNTQPYDMLEETVRINTLRLRNHPSLVMWGGGNESDKPEGEAIDMMGRLSILLDGTRPFHRAEPWGGSRHNYNCWWDDMHLNHNLNMTARFWGEFGVPSLPCPESVYKYLDSENFLFPPKESSIFTHHTPIFGTNGEIKRLGQYAGYFMPLNTLEQIIFGSQMAQVVGVRHTLERARTMWPHTTGALYYKLNDNYPGLSWSSIDYYGAHKPIHYFVKRAFEPATTVLLFDRTNMAGQQVSLPYFLLDDNMTYNGKQVTAHLTVWNHQMVCVADTTLNVTPNGHVEKIADIQLSNEQTLSEMLYFKTDLIDIHGHIIARNWYFSNFETRPGVMLESKGAKVSLEQKGDTLTLTNTSDVPAVGVTIQVPGFSSRLTLSDNYLWLDPGETIIIQTNTSRKAEVTLWNNPTEKE